MEQQVAQTRDVTLLELIERCGGERILAHPLLLQLIETAPSPKAVDEHIKMLGWPNSLAEKMRNAVRLKKRVDEQMWRELTQTNYRPVDLLLSVWEDKTIWGDLLRMSPLEVWSFGASSVDTTSWPIFLREMVFYKEDKRFTTYDGDGSVRLSPSPEELDDWRSRFDTTTLTGETDPVYKTETEKAEFALFSPISNIPIAVFRNKQTGLEVASTSIVVAPHKTTSGQLLRFVKTVEITKELEPGKWDILRIAFPQDLGPNYGSAECGIWTWDPIQGGQVNYERWIEISEWGSVKLHLPYRIDKTPERTLWRSRPDNLRITVGHTKSYGFPPEGLDVNQVTGAVKELTNLANQLMTQEDGIASLEAVCGENIWTNPPEQLSQLFCA